MLGHVLYIGMLGIGVLILLGPNFQCTLAAKLCFGPQNVFEVQERAQHAMFDGAWTSHATGRTKNVKFFVCVCLSTCYALEQQSLSEKMTSPSTHWNLEMVLISLDGERFSKGKADG